MSTAFGTLFVLKGLLLQNWSFLLLIVSMMCCLTALKKSQWLEYPRRVWIKFGVLLGKVTHPLVMGIVYFGVVTPIGIIRRKMKGYSIASARSNLDWKSEKGTFWIAQQDSKPVTWDSLRRLF